MRAELIQDRGNPEEYRVESMEDGGKQIAIFRGPDALGRAIAFAGASGYYEGGWADPDDLANPDREPVHDSDCARHLIAFLGDPAPPDPEPSR